MSADSNLSSFVNIINISKFILETIKVKESFLDLKESQFMHDVFQK